MLENYWTVSEENQKGRHGIPGQLHLMSFMSQNNEQPVPQQWYHNTTQDQNTIHSK